MERCVWDGCVTIHLHPIEVRQILVEAARKKAAETMKEWDKRLIVATVEQCSEGTCHNPEFAKVLFIEPEFKDDPVLRRRY